MNNQTSCFWAFLDAATFKFLYISTSIAADQYDALLRQTLFDLIHPEEVALARPDLTKFIQTGTLRGSITRCRFRNLRRHSPASDTFAAVRQQAWQIVDMAMYVVSERTLLAFFHVNQEQENVEFRHNNTCGEKFFNMKHARYLNSLLREYSCTDQQRVLRILDTRTKSPMLSWPEHYHDDAMAILDDPLPVDTVSCIHCSMQSRRILTPLGRTALCERITIPYGCITFTITQVSSDEYNVRSTNDQTRLPRLWDLPILVTPNEKSLSPPRIYRASDANGKGSEWMNSSTDPFIPYARRACQKQQQKSTYPIYTASRRSNSTPAAFPPQALTRRHSSPYSAQNNPRIHCESCGTSSSPEWRKGPSGHKTLCNACGLRYSRSVARRGKLAMQQAARRSTSPTITSCSSSLSAVEHGLCNQSVSM